MIAQHSSFSQPEDCNVSIWRYMDLTKFLWMIQHNALYFSRTDQLGDPYEGHYTQLFGDNDALFVAAMIAQNPEKTDTTFINEARRMHGVLKQVTVTSKSRYFVSCWHMNNEESAAMWKLYGAQQQAVCVRSTYSTLAQLLPDSCYLGCVKYIDYRSAVIPAANAFNYIVHKRKSYAHENELRAVFRDFQNPQQEKKGHSVELDLRTLIREVYVSPDSDSILYDVVNNLCQKYDLNAKVIKSGVNAAPAF